MINPVNGRECWKLEGLGPIYHPDCTVLEFRVTPLVASPPSIYSNATSNTWPAYCGNPCHPTSERRRLAFAHDAAECHVFQTQSNSPTRARVQNELDEWLPTLPRPIGILSGWDGPAAQVLDASANSHLAVPDEVAVLGVDDDDLIFDSAKIPLSIIITNRIPGRGLSVQPPRMRKRHPHVEPRSPSRRQRAAIDQHARRR